METAKYPIHPTIRRTHPRLLCLSAYIVLLSQYFRLRYMRYKLMARAYRNTKKESKHANENLANENQFRYMYIIPGENIWPPRAASRGIVFCHLFICREFWSGPSSAQCNDRRQPLLLINWIIQVKAHTKTKKKTKFRMPGKKICTCLWF